MNAQRKAYPAAATLATTSGLLYISAPSSPAKIGVNGAESARHVGCPGILTDCRERPAQGLSGTCTLATTPGLLYISAPSSPAKMGVNGAKSARHVGCPGILTDCRERPAQGLAGSCHPGNHARPAVHICPQLPCENRGQRSKKCAPRRLSRDPNRLSGTPSARPSRQLPPWQPRQACCT